MENQHEKIKGYRDLNAEEIAVMNEIKQHAEQLGALVERLDKLPNPGSKVEGGGEPAVTIDKRWLSIARTGLQQGYMALTRSVAKPTTF